MSGKGIRNEDPKNSEPRVDARLAEAGARGALRGNLAGSARLRRAAGAAQGQAPFSRTAHGRQARNGKGFSWNIMHRTLVVVHEGMLLIWLES